MNYRNKMLYIAGPLTQPDPHLNLNRVNEYVAELYAALDAEEPGHGIFLVVPHYFVLAHDVCPREYEDWMQADLTAIRHCAGVVRIWGHSPGADREEEFARAQHIEVFKTQDFTGPRELAAYILTGGR
jgi:hypothetical protein